MIALPGGWLRVASVGADIFASPDRTRQIRYRSRVAPLQRFAAIADEALAEIPEWRTRTIAARERIVTAEGEHAFGVAVAGTWLERDAQRYVGAVYGDDCYDVIDAIALGSEPVAGRALLHAAQLRLGVRRRRYFYERPAGWHGHATGLVTHWFPPRFPARASTIVVYPANPTNEQPHAVYDAMLAHHQADGGELRELASPTPIAAAAGLEGVHWRIALVAPGAPSVARDFVVLARQPYTYALQLDSCHELDYDACAVFLEVVRSVEPVPVGGVAAGGAVFSHYL